MLAPFGKRAQPLGVRFLLLLVALSLSSCAVRVPSTSPKAPTSSFFTASDNKQLSLRHWNLQPKPRNVLIALHGLEGAARDYRDLGKALSKEAPNTTLYALNLRGAGYDPSQEGRGDIRSAELWKRDLLELHQSIRKRHPEARLFWIGESMGSQIVLHTASDSLEEPHGLILVSPVVSLEAIPSWQVASLRLASFFAPEARVTLKSLAGGAFQATTNSNHFDQSETNPYHVESYTLRYLSTLAALSQSMAQKAAQVRTPTLVLHGGKDFLTNETHISKFATTFLKPPTVLEFTNSHHLLFYDKQRKEVVSRILAWISNQPPK